MSFKKYILMNQNIKVLEFNFDEELNVITEILNIYNIDYAPYKLKCDYESNGKLEKSINNWYSDRGIPVYRDNLKEIMEQFNIDTTKELINKHFALSLSDQYWVKPSDLTIQWKEINYFDNTYNAVAFANATFGENVTSSIKDIFNNSSLDKFKTPNNTTDGQLKKVWLKVNGKNYLYKASGTLYNFEPINEVLASKICEILDVPYVKYSIDVIKSKRQDTLVSICECTINKNQEIINAYNLLSDNKTENYMENYKKYLEILELHNIPHAKEYIEKMFMLDYIVLNEDRHLNNFGIIRDVNSLDWISVCPIFDTGRSMNTNVSKNYWNFAEGEVKFFSPVLVSSEILTEIFTISISEKQIFELKQLNQEYKKLLEQYREYTNLSQEQAQELVEGYQERINVFESMMSKKGLIK